VLNEAGGEPATPVLQFFESDESNFFGVLYFDEDGELVTPIAPLIEEGNNREVYTLSITVPDRAVSGVVVGIDDTETDLIDAYNALDPTNPMTDYPGFLETYLETVVEPSDVIASVARTTDALPTRTAVYEGIGGYLLGARDTANGGLAYAVPQAYVDSGGRDTTLYVQNAGTLPTVVELSLRSEGDAAARINTEAWNPEGGGQSARVGVIQPGAAKSIRLADVLPNGFSGRVVVRASEPLAIIAETAGSLASDVVPPATLNYTFDQGTATFSAGSRVVYAPLVPDVADGYTTTVHLQNAVDLGTASATSVLVEYYAADGTLTDATAVALTPFESETITIPGDFTPLDGAGWLRFAVNAPAANNNAELQGSVHVENTVTGDAFAYRLWPEYFPESKGSQFFVELFDLGVAKNFGPNLRTSRITLVNPDLSVVAQDTEVRITFLGPDGTVGVKGVIPVTIDVTLSPGELETVDIGTATELMDGFRGGVNIDISAPTGDAPATMVVIEH